jgi:ABC-2 type transport system ATP-binding protein
METAVEIKDLSVTLGGVQALKDVSLELPAGKTVGFIGPSGAGKTTLIRSIVGRLETPKGAITVFGRPAGSRELRETVRYMTQELSVYPDLSVTENLTYFSRMAGLPRAEAKQTVRRLLETTELTAKGSILVSNLSGGQKQRVSLAIALIGKPQLMVLDEPTAGLDPVLRNKLWQLFNKLAEQGTTLIISSHSMDEAQRCDDLVLIREGHIIAHDTPADLLKRTRADSVEHAFLKLVGAKKS